MGRSIRLMTVLLLAGGIVGVAFACGGKRVEQAKATEEVHHQAVPAAQIHKADSGTEQPLSPQSAQATRKVCPFSGTPICPFKTSAAVNTAERAHNSVGEAKTADQVKGGECCSEKVKSAAQSENVTPTEPKTSPKGI